MNDSADRRLVDANHAAIALFAAIIAGVLAGIGFLSRLGFSDNSPFEWARYVGLSWFLIHFSLLARKVLPINGGDDSASWWKSHASLTLAALGLVAALGIDWDDATWGGLGSKVAPGVRAAALTMLGTAGFLIACFTVLQTRRVRDIIVLALVAGFFSLYAAGASWGSGYQHPLFVEGLCFGRAQIDTLYHASISNMLRTYAVASTGLDGLPFAPYHFGSHWLFARLSNLLDARVINFYNRGYAVVFVPLGVFSLATLAVTIAQAWRSAGGPRGWRDAQTAPAETAGSAADGGEPVCPTIGPTRPIRLSFWLLLSVGYIGFLPYASNVMPASAWNINIIGESYSLAVTVSLLGTAAAWQFFEGLLARRRWRPLDAVAGVTLAVLLGLIGLLKISVMLVLAATGFYFFVRLRLFRRVAVYVLVPVAAVSVWLALRLTANPGFAQSSGFVPFGFLRWNVEWQWWPYSWLILYAWVWSVAAVRLWEEEVHTLGQLANAVRQRRLLDIEFVFVVALVGFVPGLFTDYSATYFFSEYQHWPALAFLLSIVARGCRPNVVVLATGDACERRSAAAERWTVRSALGRLSLRRIVAAVIVISVGGTLVANTLYLLGQATAADLAARGHASGQTGLGQALMHGRLEGALKILTQTAEGVESRMQSDKRVLTMLGSLDEMSLGEKRQSLLFIPKSNRQFWGLLHGPYWPKDGPFVAPALSGVAMIDGLYVPTTDDPWLGYGYHHYSRSKALRPQPPPAQYLPILRSQCARMGFKQLIVIDNEPSGTLTVHKYDCR
jgi:hypothetical protein